MRTLPRRDFVKLSSLGALGMIIGCGGDRTFDLIIRNGLVFDGLGNPAVKTDIGIRGKHIAALGDLSQARARRVIDAANMAVAPGFIDIHTHTDTELLVNGKGESKIRQGVTLEVSGNCGYSPFPMLHEDAVEFHEGLAERYGLKTSWERAAGFLDALEAAGTSLNYATLTGHGTLRSFVVGRNDVDPTPGQMALMKTVLAETMEQGSFGLSTGLEYAPGSYATTEELIDLCKTVADHNGFHATHMRNEDDTVEEAIDEALRIGRESGVFTQISHLKACNRANWHKVDHMLEMIHEARAHQPVMADRYPYDAWGTGLSAFLPLWARQGDTDEVLARLENPDDASRIEAYAHSRTERIGGWDRVMISSCRAEADKPCEGMTILEGAEQRGQSPFEFMRSLLLNSRNSVSVVGFAMDEDNLKKVLAADFVFIGSDGNAVAPYGKLYSGNPHPRYYGAHARVLGRYVREERVLELADAVRKMTSGPAEVLGISDRGHIAPDVYADLVIFDPLQVIDKATYSKPHQFAEGVQQVIVNGKVTVDGGEHTGVMAGQVLRHSSS